MAEAATHGVHGVNAPMLLGGSHPRVEDQPPPPPPLATVVGTGALEGVLAAFLLPRDLYQLRQAARPFTRVELRHLRSSDELAQVAGPLVGAMKGYLQDPRLLAATLPVISYMLCHSGEEQGQQTLRRLLSMFLVGDPSVLEPALPLITCLCVSDQQRWQQTLRRLLSVCLVAGDKPRVAAKASVLTVLVALPAMPALTSLNLANNAIGPKGATHIANAVKGHVSAVLALRLMRILSAMI
jgi:hypothetical protein